jgi:hypothetical protein
VGAGVTGATKVGDIVGIEVGFVVSLGVGGPRLQQELCSGDGYEANGDGSAGEQNKAFPLGFLFLFLQLYLFFLFLLAVLFCFSFPLSRAHIRIIYQVLGQVWGSWVEAWDWAWVLFLMSSQRELGRCSEVAQECAFEAVELAIEWGESLGWVLASDCGAYIFPWNASQQQRSHTEYNESTPAD